jgi:hypothetical protein
MKPPIVKKDEKKIFNKSILSNNKKTNVKKNEIVFKRVKEFNDL